MDFYLVTYISLILNTGVLSKYTRIVGGQDADITKYPYMVSIKTIDNARHYCGGVIITNRNILTAAHCFEEYNHTELKIYTGSTLSNSSGPHYTMLEVKFHPDYIGLLTKKNCLQNDIAVITIEGRIEFNEFQKKIKLPTKNIETDNNAKIMGWGLTKYPGSYSEKLQEASTTILNNSVCAKSVSFDVHDGQICALNTKGIGSCIGDSGGPLVSSDGVLVGIHSFSSVCAKGVPDTFTRVYYYLDFIKEVLYASNCLFCHIL